MTLPKCALCRENDADKTNSHIVPLCVIKNLVAIDSSKKARDRELSFSISSNSLSTAYVGRDILPEKVEQLFGEKIAEQVATQGKNQFAQDFFLCSSCEKKLGELESNVNKNFLDRIDKFRSDKGTTIIFDENVQQIKLFFWSIIFRMSVTRFGNFSLPKSFEENLRAILNKELNNIAEKPIRSSFPLQLLVVESRKNDSTNIVLNVPSKNSPYYLFLNQFIVLYYYKEKSLNHPPESCMGMEKSFERGILSETGTITVTKIKETLYEEWTEAILRPLASDMNEQIAYYFKECYKRVTGSYPTLNLLKDFFTHLHKDPDSLGKYTLEGLAVVIHEFIKKKIFIA